MSIFTTKVCCGNCGQESSASTEINHYDVKFVEHECPGCKKVTKYAATTRPTFELKLTKMESK